jgi:peptidoglycan/xylan/chitin deacetylase (PgdA/CDA1 family)
VSNEAYPRDLIGYGRELPHAQWPNDARIAIVIAVNYETGGEMSILHGDRASEAALSDTPFPSYVGERSMLVESSYEFGSRRGIWRLFDIFQERSIRVNLFGVVMALERNPEVARAFAEAGHEIVAHGYRWIDYREVSEQQERELMQRAIEGIESLTGRRPAGWMTGRPSVNTRRRVVEHGFEYDRDALNDELPYGVEVEGRPHLVIPYSYDVNDMRYGSTQGGFVTGEDFYTYLRETFDQMYAEGATRPKLMSIGLHERTVGRAGRAWALTRFLDYVLEHDGVWFASGKEVADHWKSVHPYQGSAS